MRAILTAGILAFFGAASFPAVEPTLNKTKKPTLSLPTGQLDTKDWLGGKVALLQKGEVDRLVTEALKKAGVKPAPVTTDEQFLRRASLDLTGRLPSPKEIETFLANQDPAKRARTIDKLLDSDDFAKHWALYFRDVINSRVTEQRANLVARHFEVWLSEQFKANKSWAYITKEILTASGEMKFDAPSKNGQGYFLATRRGPDAENEFAAETSRIFSGIQIQCAQCHDHPSDIWKREQFHELAAYFSRVRQQPIFEEMRLIGNRVVSRPFGEHTMTAADDPKKTSTIHPRFIDGKSPGIRLDDKARRKSLANAIVAKENPWFAAAFVNRIWGELMGQSFYMPIDDMGPQKEAILPDVAVRVAAAFRASDYDIKGLFRELMNSDTYQRQIRPGEAPHLLFAAHNLTRMNGAEVWQALVDIFGDINAGKGTLGRGGMGGPLGRNLFENVFKREFGFDPSTKPEEVEGSISQALMLMNNPLIQAKLRATGSNMLAGILAQHAENDEAIRALYLRTLARRPSDRELERCRKHIQSLPGRAEAFEDLLWALINSTEFLSQR